MRKLFTVTIAACTLILLIVSCNSNSGDRYILKMRLAKGDTFTQSIDMNMDMTMSVMGMNQNMNMKMDMSSDFEVKDSTAAGKLLEMTYTKMKMGMKMAAAPGVDFDSIMNAATSQAIGKSILMTIKDNKVINVSGMDSLMIGQDSASTEITKKLYDKENLNQTFAMMFNVFPDKPVRVGDSWERDNEIEISMMKMKIKTTYTLAGVKNGIAELTINGKIDSKGTFSQGGMEMNMDMKGTQKGRTYIIAETGYTDNSNYDLDIDANMEVMGQKIPMKLKAKYNISGKK